MKENNSPAWLNFHTLHGDVPYLKDTIYFTHFFSSKVTSNTSWETRLILAQTRAQTRKWVPAGRVLDRSVKHTPSAGAPAATTRSLSSLNS